MGRSWDLKRRIPLARPSYRRGLTWATCCSVLVEISASPSSALQILWKLTSNFAGASAKRHLLAFGLSATGLCRWGPRGTQRCRLAPEDSHTTRHRIVSGDFARAHRVSSSSWYARGV